MPIFTVEKIAGLPPNQAAPFYKLVVDGNCLFDEFWERMERAGNHKGELLKLQAIMAELCLGKRVPPGWCKELKNKSKGDSCPDFELKCKQLRIYFFEDKKNGKIVVLGELKKDSKSQQKSIKKMRELKLAYFASKRS
jgi:hypothetical protein